MASVSNLVERIVAAAGRGEAETVTRKFDGNEYELRALPNEEIYLWIREVDNSRVNARSDPKSTRACLRYIGGACLAVMFLVGVLAPVAYNVLAGYRIHTLEQERETLLIERSELELREAELLNPARLAELAELQQLVDPAPETSVPLDPVSGGALAYNRKP